MGGKKRQVHVLLIIWGVNSEKEGKKTPSFGFLFKRINKERHAKLRTFTELNDICHEGNFPSLGVC